MVLQGPCWMVLLSSSLLELQVEVGWCSSLLRLESDQVRVSLDCLEETR
jgi:hypothetical protein